MKTELEQFEITDPEEIDELLRATTLDIISLDFTEKEGFVLPAHNDFNTVIYLKTPDSESETGWTIWMLKLTNENFGPRPQREAAAARIRNKFVEELGATIRDYKS